MSIFERASKQKIRFGTAKGLLSTEDLWDIPLEGSTSLDAIARDLNSQIKGEEEVSFVQTKSTANATLALKFDIVKSVIASRLKQAESNEKAAATRTHNARIDNLIAKKKDEELENLSLEALEKLREG